MFDSWTTSLALQKWARPQNYEFDCGGTKKSGQGLANNLMVLKKHFQTHVYRTSCGQRVAKLETCECLVSVKTSCGQWEAKNWWFWATSLAWQKWARPQKIWVWWWWHKKKAKGWPIILWFFLRNTSRHMCTEVAPNHVANGWPIILWLLRSSKGGHDCHEFTWEMWPLLTNLWTWMWCH